ncbi:MAG: hypothetical protein AVDCRST_MAG59-88 [uncultured Thermomicrobiales bacterium]|uniref:Uncharacterized protein n=1 Tax=uncultured Thermomicrobiales bacterium TaxID=1645740 RepID=A0A6J4TY72_9BACT|nr:MAG: hypothetical protein AVDCRST_MAG59-88 [uncultured Thermomicrobiales bacterium]
MVTPSSQGSRIVTGWNECSKGGPSGWSTSSPSRWLLSSVLAAAEAPRIGYRGLAADGLGDGTGTGHP